MIYNIGIMFRVTYLLWNKQRECTYRFLWIHPFPNGNGRFSRLVSDMYLKGLRCKHPVWPSDLQNDGPIRKKYINTLKSADSGDFQAF